MNQSLYAGIASRYASVTPLGKKWFVRLLASHPAKSSFAFGCCDRTVLNAKNLRIVPYACVPFPFRNWMCNGETRHLRRVSTVRRRDTKRAPHLGYGFDRLKGQTAHSRAVLFEY